MKKKILALAFVCMSVAGFGAVAQTTCDNGGCNKKESTCAKQGKKGGDRVNPFEGLNLTDSQKGQLKELREKKMASRKAMAEARKADKQRNDSVRMADRKASRKQYLEEVKAIVGPENYVVFLENMVINGNQGQNKAGVHGKNFVKGHKNAMRHGKKGGKSMNNADLKSQPARQG
ncbi:MAG: Spy/CpxP family protein refolding chaperone [Muribaculaceae bacterium]|nr:Spy/CpxP family protein refolding chaperone [Muribaculaceae bacterium]